jgi:hypothetical protein
MAEQRAAQIDRRLKPSLGIASLKRRRFRSLAESRLL